MAQTEQPFPDAFNSSKCIIRFGTLAYLDPS